jgi:hypothetical protein
MDDRHPLRRLLKLDTGDNVAVAIFPLARGEVAELDGATIIIAEDIPFGHKVAVVPVEIGEKIRKYGCPIGSATSPITPGQHVHTHNLKSDYFPTFGLHPNSDV